MGMTFNTNLKAAYVPLGNESPMGNEVAWHE